MDLAAQLQSQEEKRASLTLFARGKNIALIFEKTSTRTRCSFEVAAHDLGMNTTYLDPTGSQIGKKESIADTARVLGRMFDGIEYRGYGQEIVEELARIRRRPGLERADKRIPPDTDISRFSDQSREHFGRLARHKASFIWATRATIWAIPLWSAAPRWGCSSPPAHRKAYFPDTGAYRDVSRASRKKPAPICHFVRRPCSRRQKAPTSFIPTCGSPWASLTGVWQERINAIFRPIR